MTSKKTVQNSKRIFITGITGQLGSTLNKYLSRYFNVLNNQENLFIFDTIGILNRDEINLLSEKHIVKVLGRGDI